MLESLFNFAIDVFFWLCGIVGSLIIYPIQALVVTIFPSIGDYIVITLNFFTGRIFPMISFAKALFLGVTGMPPAVFSIFVTFLLVKWAIAPAIRSIVFIINVIRLIQGGMTINLQHGSKYVSRG